MGDRKRSTFIIKDGTIVDEGYEHEVHTFFDDQLLRVLLVLPGIIPETADIRTKGNELYVEVRLAPPYRMIYQADLLRLHYRLVEPVREKVVVASYDAGILELKLVREKFSYNK